jgi:poly-gamma-glutamate synthesis protein (capsule biosynthesis protein)
MLTRRSILPVCGIIPFTRWPIEIIPKPPETRVVFGGDIMLSRAVRTIAQSKNDPASPMRDIAPWFAGADIAFANLESPFSDRARVGDSRMIFKAEPAMIAALEIAGIDVVSTANNHSRDCGAYGVEYTLDLLEQHGIAAVGTGRSEEAAHAGAVIERNGLKFGFLGYTFDQTNGNHTDIDERVALINIEQMRSDVAALLRRADIAIVSMHAGVEYAPKPNAQQVAFARAAIDAGARVVVGHHPHVVQPWERYKAGVIFYSLGNLVFDQFQRAETQRGAVAEVVFSSRTLFRAEVLPVNIVRSVPRLAAGA